MYIPACNSDNLRAKLSHAMLFSPNESLYDEQLYSYSWKLHNSKSVLSTKDDDKDHEYKNIIEI